MEREITVLYDTEAKPVNVSSLRSQTARLWQTRCRGTMTVNTSPTVCCEGAKHEKHIACAHTRGASESQLRN